MEHMIFQMMSKISTHTSLAGRDSPSGVTFKYLVFLLTRPSRDVTMNVSDLLYVITISTHTSLAGRDLEPETWEKVLNHFYSHVPRGT